MGYQCLYDEAHVIQVLLNILHPLDGQSQLGGGIVLFDVIPIAECMVRLSV